MFNLYQTYKLDLETFYDVLEARPTEDKLTMCALVSAQKCLLCLGDLARYKETIQETCNYGVARQHYQKARRGFYNSFSAILHLKTCIFQASNVDTRNGRPFNQLAILAFQTKRKFEAVYYNMRCLQVRTFSPPIIAYSSH